MAVQVTFPGVYIEEFTPGAPIAGVGTSIAAFLGPSQRGPLREPTPVTSWEQFVATFGDQPVNGFFLWYAVQGFFRNGGQVCYVVRISNGDYARLTVDNVAGNPVFTVFARDPGVPAAAITVQVVAQNQIPAATTSVYRPASNYTALAGRVVTLVAGGGALFRPRDWVVLGAVPDRAQVARVSGDELRLVDEPTGGPPNAGAIRLANVPIGARTIRIEPAAALAPDVLMPGTILTIAQGANPPDSQVVESATVEPGTAPVPTTYRVTFRQGLEIPIDLAAAAARPSVQSEEFDLRIGAGGAPVVHPNLSIESVHRRYVEKVVNEESEAVRIEMIEPPPADTPPNTLPDVMAAAVPLAGGVPEDLAGLVAADFTRGLDTLREVDKINLVAVPDGVARVLSDPNIDTIQQAVIAHCEQLADRFAVLDARPGRVLFGANSIEEQRRALDSTRGYGALYYPWLRVPSANGGAPVLAPPSGHVCGVIARSDMSRGVHKAPANEIINNVVGLERPMSNTDHGLLNLQGINVIRQFHPGGRLQLFGARTTATDISWQHINVRRLFLFLEESIQEGIHWALFEPNNTGLWQKLKRTITAFLHRVWREGALFGETPEQAFYVRIDEALNPDSDRALGRLTIEIGVRPSYPAEFIIVRIGIWQGGSEIVEV